ncbi:SAF domain-containing protein, partial [Salinimicrobium oceani]|nr:N-acetylneuraminate synthase [Salinimicrobium oceani]
PDASSSLEIHEITKLVSAVKNINLAQQHPVDKSDNSSSTDLKNIFEKSLAVNKDLPADHILTFEDLESKKPKGYGIEASKFREVIGRKLNRELKQWEFLNEQDLS